MTGAPLVDGLGRAIAVPAECVPPGSEDSVRPTASAATAPDVTPTTMRTRERAAFRSGRADPMICWYIPIASAESGPGSGWRLAGSCALSNVSTSMVSSRMSWHRRCADRVFWRRVLERLTHPGPGPVHPDPDRVR